MKVDTNNIDVAFSHVTLLISAEGAGLATAELHANAMHGAAVIAREFLYDVKRTADAIEDIAHSQRVLSDVLRRESLRHHTNNCARY